MFLKRVLTERCSAPIRARPGRSGALRQSRPLGAAEPWKGRGGVRGQQLPPQRLLERQKQGWTPDQKCLYRWKLRQVQSVESKCDRDC